MKRSDFMKLMAAGAGIFAPIGLTAKTSLKPSGNSFSSPLVVSSGNGLPATQRAMEMIMEGSDVLDAVISGVNIVEDDPEDMSVGYGGLPNEDGIVELDACCMHGPTHNAGAVASLRNIKNPSKVAQLVMGRTDHVLLVAEGALEFARAHGFQEEDLLTDKAREYWLRYKENLSDKDDWFSAEQQKEMSLNGLEVIKNGKKKRITGTISCLGLDSDGNISGVTTTSGLFFKIPGRVGDSPIIGAGLYVDNEVGACGSTGRGEENLKNLSSFLAVEYMRQGMSPTNACLEVCKRIVDKARLPNLLDDKGMPDFNVNFYALNKKGEYGCASIYGPSSYAVNDGKENTRKEGAYLYSRN
ncbi:N(4)-(beta-N-acetylglucosaminyl)-L-asparaginase [Balneolaceae bacterium YR4-1]|uniref:N(4)-(Beta-N-acetylglucosaminyl)-L-asparaginase n=1 Tax=Halalkalibaculum roseum TaxID=2709311 RepID=A0A6M1SW55_9BACT|nr:N(4)-(beta-N-acetylglucosaminyl)-L-asparaginase [Halalkalibaculum roseum]NGP76378.1 N(4)-(beta-N-acetylglucosaminyl)-L-asparaginase [Halalkalibaculum roseum]